MFQHFIQFGNYWTRVLVSAVHGFYKHEGFLKAARLTYYTLLAIVPVLAVAFGIAKGFGFEHYFQRQLLAKFAEQTALVNRAAEFAHNLLAKTQEGFLVSIGFIAFFWTAFTLLSHIESALNEIWEVKKARSIGRKITDYLALIIICPFFFVFSNSAALFVISRLGELAETTVAGPINPWVYSVFNILVTFILSWFLFGFIYWVMLNTKIELKSAVIAGIVGGSLYQIVQWIYITFQIGASNLGAIYGSFAALPLFLLWVNSNWLIFLFGAEIGYFAEDESYAISNGSRASEAEIALLIASYCIKAFCREEPPPSLKNLSSRLQIPVGATRKIVNRLIENKILTEIQDENAFLPAKNIDSITVQTVLHGMDKSRHNLHFTRKSSELIQMQQLVNAFDQEGKNSQENKSLRDCID